jgi:hypothetical protein
LRERRLHGGRQNDHVALQDEIGAGETACPGYGVRPGVKPGHSTFRVWNEIHRR